MAIVGVSVGALAAAGSPAAIAATGGGSGPTSAAQILGNVAAGNAVQGGGQALAASGSVGTQVNLTV
ncbi:MAG TPA: hypothetical protein VM689_05800 [Aliidongia sp.]|nr:hypothetical protein [Aliidongia sp.]